MRDFLKGAVTVCSQARWLTRERLLLAGAACAFATIVLLALDLTTYFDFPGLTKADGEHFGRDFVQFWSSAKFAAAGAPAAAYILQPHQRIDQVFAYPPIVMLLCRPLAELPYLPAVLIWGAPGLVLFVVTLSRLVGWESAVFAALGTPAAALNLYLQQNGFYTAVLIGGGLMLVESRPALAGILFGMLCCKPQLAILLLPALVAGRHWRVLMLAALTGAGLSLASLVLFGPQTWIGFFGRTAAQNSWMAQAVPAWSWMPTVFAMMRLIGVTSHVAYALQGISTILAGVGVVLLWRSNATVAIKSAGLVTATFLATPYAWDYDAVVLAFAAAWLAREASHSGFLPWEKITVLGLLALPALSTTAAKLADLQIGPVLLWLALGVVMRRAARPSSVPVIAAGARSAQPAV